MNKHIRTFFAASAICATSTVLPAFGSEFSPLHVTVPFAFAAGRTNFPAGDYTVVENDSHIVTIRGARGSVMLLGMAGEEGQRDNAALSFRHTEKGYVLRAVHAVGRSASVLPDLTDPER